jgi:hypothetical protein
MLEPSEVVVRMNLRKFSAVNIGVVACMSLLLWGSGSAGAATVRDRQALSKAKSDLRAEPYSLEGLVVQLNFGGYTMAEATYGAENSGANWNHEALVAAKENLATKAYSMKGLIERLKIAKFTAVQASYGVANSGANWNAEAYKAAEESLAVVKIPTSELIGQLRSSGFTAAQATYGANRAE